MAYEFVQNIQNMATYKFLKDLCTGDDNDSIKVRVSRDWDGRKTGSTYVAKKNYLLLDEEVCLITLHIYTSFRMYWSVYIYTRCFTKIKLCRVHRYKP